jgi:hypothetical protein
MDQATFDKYWKLMHPKPRTCNVDGKTEIEAPHVPTVDAKGRVTNPPKCGPGQWS